MKNVLQVMPEFGLAGAETMCETLCYELQESGKYNVFVASLFNFHSPITERLESKGIQIHYLDKKNGFDLSLIAKLYRVMRDYHIDIVHTHRYVMQYAIPAAIMAGVKIRVHTVHNIATKEVSAYRRKLAYFFYKSNNVIPVSISPIVQTTVVEEYHISKERTPVVYNGTNLSRCPVKQDYSSSDTFNIVHIGRFNPQKNHGVIIETAKILKDNGFKFVVNLIGGGENEQSCKEYVERLGLDDVISFRGLQSDVYPFLQKADCFILPSLYEGMPVTLVEAMGCGLPIVASAVGGVPDMINDEESGLLIKPTVDDLQFAIKRIMHDEKLRAKLGKNALNESKRFSAKEMCKGYIKVYESSVE